MRPVFYGYHHLRQAGVSLQVSGEATDRPDSRLSDGDPQLVYRDSGNAGLRVWQADQGDGTEPIGAWGLWPGHTLAGVPCVVETSDDGAAWSAQDSVTPADAGALVRPFQGLTDGSGNVVARFIRLSVEDPAAPVEMTELMFSRPVAVPFGPTTQSLTMGLVANRLTHEGVDGTRWSVIQGSERYKATYTMRDFAAADRDAWLALYRAIRGGADPMLVTDPEGVTRLLYWTNAEALFAAADYLRGDVSIELLEAR